MKIDKRLNLVIPIDEGGVVSYVHSQPLDRIVFERYFLVISRTFSAIVQYGLGEIAGPAVSAMMLKKVATDLGVWEDVERGLVAEIRRTSNLMVPSQAGWQTIPLQEAIDKKMMSESDLAEVENAITFFIVYSAIHRRATLIETLDGAAKLWGAQVTSLAPMEYVTSLKTSRDDANTGERAPVSSIPH